MVLSIGSLVEIVVGSVVDPVVDVTEFGHVNAEGCTHLLSVHEKIVEAGHNIRVAIHTSSASSAHEK